MRSEDEIKEYHKTYMRNYRKCHTSSPHKYDRPRCETAVKHHYKYLGKRYDTLKEIIEVSGASFETLGKWLKKGTDRNGNIIRKITEVNV